MKELGVSSRSFLRCFCQRMSYILVRCVLWKGQMKLHSLKRRLKDTVNNYTHLDIWKPHQIQEDVQTVNIQISYSC